MLPMQGARVPSHIASHVAQSVKHLLAVWETWVQFLGREVPLEKEMTTHFSILAWRIPWREESGGLQSTGSQRVGHDLELSFFWVPALVRELDPTCRKLKTSQTPQNPMA